MDPEAGGLDPTLPVNGNGAQNAGSEETIVGKLLSALRARLQQLVGALGGLPGQQREVGVENRFYYCEVEKRWKLEGGETEEERARSEATRFHTGGATAGLPTSAPPPPPTSGGGGSIGSSTPAGFGYVLPSYATAGHLATSAPPQAASAPRASPFGAVPSQAAPVALSAPPNGARPFGASPFSGVPSQPPPPLASPFQGSGVAQASPLASPFQSPLAVDAPQQANGSGVVRSMLNAGDQVNFPKTGDELSMHYTGMLASTGSKFDSSVDRGRPFVFKIGLGNVIQGWDVGVAQMSLGEKAKLAIPPELAYGIEGAPPVIPPNANLVFELELLAINSLKSRALVEIEELQASIAQLEATPPMGVDDGQLLGHSCQRMSTAPTASAMPVTDGLPVSWPLPTKTQQIGATNQAVADANKACQDASAGAGIPAVGEPVPSHEVAHMKSIFDALLNSDAHNGNTKKRDDISKRLEELYVKLAAGQIKTHASQKAMLLVHAVEQNDFATANQCVKDLCSVDWEANKSWLMGVKRLLPAS